MEDHVVDDPPTVISYAVQELDDDGAHKFILCVPREGSSVLCYLCNALIFRGRLIIKLGDVHDGKISEGQLIRKLVEIFIGHHGQFCRANGLDVAEEDVLQEVVEAINSKEKLEPTCQGIDSFKDVRRLIMLNSLVHIFHGHAVDPQNLQLMDATGNKGCFELAKTVKNKRKRRNLDQKWTDINYHLNQHSPYSVSCLLEQMSTGVLGADVAVFYWKKQFSTIKVHGGNVYVLNAVASCPVNEVIWQRLTAITVVDGPDKLIFFDSQFGQCEGEKLDTINGHLSEISTKREFIEILVQYEDEFISKGLTKEVNDSIQKNARLAAVSSWLKVSTRIVPIILDHLGVYRICQQPQATIEESLNISDKALSLRTIKASILLVVKSFMERAEYSQQLEETWIVPFVQTIMTDFFELAHDKIPVGFLPFLMTIVKKCKDIDQVSEFLCPHAEGEMNFLKCLDLFSVLQKILSRRFELVEKLPVQHVLRNFSWALEQNSNRLVDYLSEIVEFLNTFEKSIKGDKLVGPSLNNNISVIFGTIVSLYSNAIARTEHSGMSEENRRSFDCAIYKLGESFLEKAEGCEQIETEFVIPLMIQALNGYMENAVDTMPQEFLSLSKIIIKKCSGVRTIIENILNCSQELAVCEIYHGYIFLVLHEACAHCYQVLTQLPPVQLKYMIEFTKWAVKHNELNISKAGINLSMEIVKAFEALNVENSSYEKHVLGILDDVVLVLIGSPDLELETSCFTLLKQLLVVIDGFSEPLWDETDVPIHYNSMFGKERAAKLVQKELQDLPYSQATKFVDGIFAARHDCSHFTKRARDLLIQLKKPPHASEIFPVSTSNDTQQLSDPSNDLFEETFEKHYEERVTFFLKTYTQDGCHSPHYEGVVYHMYVTGTNKMAIEFNHIISFNASLAKDLIVFGNRLQHKIKVAVSKFVCGMKTKLDLIFKDSHPHFSKLSLCGEISVHVADIPESMENFSDFIKDTW